MSSNSSPPAILYHHTHSAQIPVAESQARHIGYCMWTCEFVCNWLISLRCHRLTTFCQLHAMCIWSSSFLNVRVADWQCYWRSLCAVSPVRRRSSSIPVAFTELGRLYSYWAPYITISDVSRRFLENALLLNPTKTEVVLFCTRQHLVSYWLLKQCYWCWLKCAVNSSVKVLGVTLDCTLSFACIECCTFLLFSYTCS